MQPLHLRGFKEELRKLVAKQYELHGLKLHPEASPNWDSEGLRWEADAHLSVQTACCRPVMAESHSFIASHA